jgi:hypothetical protein
MTCVICKSLFTQEDDEMRKFSFNNASSDSNRLKLWKIACGKPESWKPSTRSRICARHFESKYFQSDSKFTNLLPNAVPTIDCHRKFFFHPQFKVLILFFFNSLL